MELGSERHSFTPASKPCYDFTVDGYQREKRTVIIAPIRIEEVDVGAFQISWTCSRGPFCTDKECRYSKKADLTENLERLEPQLDR